MKKRKWTSQQKLQIMLAGLSEQIESANYATNMKSIKPSIIFGVINFLNSVTLFSKPKT